MISRTDKFMRTGMIYVRSPSGSVNDDTYYSVTETSVRPSLPREVAPMFEFD